MGNVYFCLLWCFVLCYEEGFWIVLCVLVIKCVFIDWKIYCGKVVIVFFDNVSFICSNVFVVVSIFIGKCVWMC